MTVLSISFLSTLCLILLLHCPADGLYASTRQCDVCLRDNYTCELVSGVLTHAPDTSGYHRLMTIPAGACHVIILEMTPSTNFLALRQSDSSFTINGDWTASSAGSYRAAHSIFQYNIDPKLGNETIFSSGPLREPVELFLVRQELNVSIGYRYHLPKEVPGASSTYTRSGSYQDAGGSYGDQGDSSAGMLLKADSPTDEQRSKRTETSNYAPPGNIMMRQATLEENSAWTINYDVPCSKLCGGGVKVPAIECVNRQLRRTVDDLFCTSAHRPSPGVIPCNTHQCFMQHMQTQWQVGEWSACNATCGAGLQYRTVLCYSNNRLTGDQQCLWQQSKPGHVRSCSQGPCQASWMVGDWDKCSSECGWGVRSRVVKCATNDKLGLNGPDYLTSHKPLCQDKKPRNTTACFNSVGCHTNGDINSHVNVTVPGGVTDTDSTGVPPAHYTSFQSNMPHSHSRTSTEKALSLNDRRLSDSIENSRYQRPSSSSPESGFLPPNGDWLAGPWSACSSQCGVGQQVRHVFCWKGSSCAPLRMPEPLRSCQSTEWCGATWVVGPWSQCESASCHYSKPLLSQRSVLCVSILPNELNSTVQHDSRCSSLVKPASTRQCPELTTGCQSKWYTGSWDDQCPSSCHDRRVNQQLYSFRVVTCLSVEGNDSDSCSASVRPRLQRLCDKLQCPFYPNGTSSNTGAQRARYLYANSPNEPTRILPTTLSQHGLTGNSLFASENSATAKEIGLPSSGFLRNFANPMPDKVSRFNFNADSSPPERTFTADETDNSARVMSASEGATNLARAGSYSFDSRSRATMASHIGGMMVNQDILQKQTIGVENQRREMEVIPKVADSVCVDHVVECYTVDRDSLCRQQYYATACCKTCSSVKQDVAEEDQLDERLSLLSSSF